MRIGWVLPTCLSLSLCGGVPVHVGTGSQQSASEDLGQALAGRHPAERGYTLSEMAHVWYKVYDWNQAKNWTSAAKICDDNGGILISSTSTERLQLVDEIRDSRLNRALPWIGCNKLKDNTTWVWMDGAPVDGAHWGPGEPDPVENCCGQYESRWFAAPCDLEWPFVCEFLR